MLNKEDLPLIIDKSKLNDFEIIRTSFKNNIGIDELIDKIKEMFNLNIIDTGDFTYLSNSRQISIVKNAISLTNEIYESNKKCIPVDLIQIDIQRLWELLGELTGESSSEELLDEIFSKFCLGK